MVNNPEKPIKVVNSIKIPALFGHGLQDTLIPSEHTKELYKNYSGLKQIVIFEGDHNSPRSVNFILATREFLKKHLVGNRKSETIMIKKTQIPVYSTGFGIKNKIMAKSNLKVLPQEKIINNDKYGLIDKNNMEDSHIIGIDNRLVVTERANNNREILNDQDCQKLNYLINDSNDSEKKRHYRHSSFMPDYELSKLACLNQNSILSNISNNLKILGNKNDKKQY